MRWDELDAEPGKKDPSTPGWTVRTGHVIVALRSFNIEAKQNGATWHLEIDGRAIDPVHLAADLHGYVGMRSIEKLLANTPVDIVEFGTVVNSMRQKAKSSRGKSGEQDA